MEIEVQRGDTFLRDDMYASQHRAGLSRAIGEREWNSKITAPIGNVVRLSLADFTRIAYALGHTVNVIAPEPEIETVPLSDLNYGVRHVCTGVIAGAGTKKFVEDYVGSAACYSLVRLAPPESREDDGPFWAVHIGNDKMCAYATELQRDRACEQPYWKPCDRRGNVTTARAGKE